MHTHRNLAVRSEMTRQATFFLSATSYNAVQPYLIKCFLVGLRRHSSGLVSEKELMDNSPTVASHTAGALKFKLRRDLSLSVTLILYD